MRIRLTSPWDWRVPGKRAIISFEPGEYTMTREQGEAAVDAGVGTEMEAGGENRPKGPNGKRHAASD